MGYQLSRLHDSTGACSIRSKGATPKGRTIIITARCYCRVMEILSFRSYLRNVRYCYVGTFMKLQEGGVTVSAWTLLTRKLITQSKKRNVRKTLLCWHFVSTYVQTSAQYFASHFSTRQLHKMLVWLVNCMTCFPGLPIIPGTPGDPSSPREPSEPCIQHCPLTSLISVHAAK